MATPVSSVPEVLGAPGDDASMQIPLGGELERTWGKGLLPQQQYGSATALPADLKQCPCF